MSERKRATGFVLMDAAFAADAKFRKLERQAESPHDYLAAVGCFWVLLADARRGKSAVIDWDDYEEWAIEIAELRAARLLDEHGFDPEVFERWAPAYRSVSERTQSYSGYGRVREDTKSTVTSGQVSSSPLTSTDVNGNARAESFMRWTPRDPEGGAGLWHGKGAHDGSHPDCAVCAPLQAAPSSEKGTP